MHPETPSAEVLVVAQALRDYLLQPPRAADTAEGIQRWWLLSSFGELPLTTVEAALAQLEVEVAVCRVDTAWVAPAWAVRADPATAAAPARTARTTRTAR